MRAELCAYPKCSGKEEKGRSWFQSCMGLTEISKSVPLPTHVHITDRHKNTCKHTQTDGQAQTHRHTRHTDIYTFSGKGTCRYTYRHIHVHTHLLPRITLAGCPKPRTQDIVLESQLPPLCQCDRGCPPPAVPEQTEGCGQSSRHTPTPDLLLPTIPPASC